MPKKDVTEVEEQDGKGLLTQLNDYLAAGVHIGTKFKTKFMQNYIFKTRDDGLTILNVQKIDKRIRTIAQFLSQFEPKDILIVGRRDSAKKPISVFAKITNIQAIPGRYLPGTLTNHELPKYHEAKIMIASDPWSDKNAVNDALKSNIPVIALADSNNSTQKIDLVLPCNNKGKKSLATIYFLLAREYIKARGELKNNADFKYEIKDFMEEKTKE
ncbi:MAG: 30S ribosomal protein S2 [Nanoarchaeota archaeon]|nr:30S ribosomal protein S2 [Nanoarchaeota archaeon]